MVELLIQWYTTLLCVQEKKNGGNCFVNIFSFCFGRWSTWFSVYSYWTRSNNVETSSFYEDDSASFWCQTSTNMSSYKEGNKFLLVCLEDIWNSCCILYWLCCSAHTHQKAHFHLVGSGSQFRRQEKMWCFSTLKLLCGTFYSFIFPELERQYKQCGEWLLDRT